MSAQHDSIRGAIVDVIGEAKDNPFGRDFLRYISLLVQQLREARQSGEITAKCAIAIDRATYQLRDLALKRGDIQPAIDKLWQWQLRLRELSTYGMDDNNAPATTEQLRKGDSADNIPPEYRSGGKPDGMSLTARAAADILGVDQSTVARNLDERKAFKGTRGYVYTWNAVVRYAKANGVDLSDWQS